MATYEIKYEPVTVEGIEYPKYNIYYSDGLKEFHSTDGVNGTIKSGYTNVNAPNYYGLEQGLFKSSLFSKYIMDYNTKGLLFTQTINNGKRGEDVNENTLLAGFQVMQIAFTEPEKAFINNVLSDNNFSIRL